MTNAGPWATDATHARERAVLAGLDDVSTAGIEAEVVRLAEANRTIHEVECINLNPATNLVNPRAEALLAAGLSSRPSLGHPGDKYETGLEAIEAIEVIATDLARRVFEARWAEVRVPTGAMANLYGILATTSPGDVVIAPPASIAGHVTHHDAGVAGLLGRQVVDAPVDAARYTVDVDALAQQAHEVRPALITVGGSLNLLPHPVAAIREVADGVGATVLFDAAHLCGLIAGGAWPNPLEQGAHLLTMSTYKSLGGPAAGLVLTNDDELAEGIDAIAHPGMTANFDVGKTAALAVTLLDWLEAGEAYARAMVDTAAALAARLADVGLPVFRTTEGPTTSHQLAIEAARWDGGQAAARRLRRANLLACGIGLPIAEVDDDLNGLRLGTPEVARIGMGADEMAEVAELVADALSGDPTLVAPRTTALRRRFDGPRFVRDDPRH